MTTREWSRWQGALSWNGDFSGPGGNIKSLDCAFCGYKVLRQYTRKPHTSTSVLGWYNVMRGAMIKHLHEQHKDQLAEQPQTRRGNKVNVNLQEIRDCRAKIKLLAGGTKDLAGRASFRVLMRDEYPRWRVYRKGKKRTNGTTFCVHFISTEIRDYNSVDSKKHFQRVRRHWKDHSKVIGAFIWILEEGWQRFDAKDW